MWLCKTEPVPAPVPDLRVRRLSKKVFAIGGVVGYNNKARQVAYAERAGNISLRRIPKRRHLVHGEVKNMTNYELMFIIDPKLDQEQKDAEIEKVKGIISENGGELGEADVWGIRKLAYPIMKNTEGFYVVLPFQADPELPKELDRRLKISDAVIRHMIINKDEK